MRANKQANSRADSLATSHRETTVFATTQWKRTSGIVGGAHDADDSEPDGVECVVGVMARSI